ncbi:aspartate/glutamate racemase family protein [archaeon]|nr:aspartate/glutamate racemase family protein [archaeon]MBL7057375.1 aspartate/glutamate racemase family protein [Candidatus Woesearchaeota archaeon]
MVVVGGNVKIGVLGGIGPEATGEFYNKLIHRLQSEGLINSNQDFPKIIINSVPAPELVSTNIKEDELKEYLVGLKELDYLNTDFIVMVCNTIHLFHEKLQSEINTQILDLREEVKTFLIDNNIGEVLIIGTPQTVKSGLYNFEEIKTITPNNFELKKLSHTIFNYNKGFEKEKQIAISKDVCQKYLDRGVKKIILGCTEFAVMLKNENIPTINTVDILVDATIKRFILNKQKVIL